MVSLMRLFGLFESATFVGSHYIMGSWYNSEEIGKRTAVFAASGVAGNMFSGFLQGAIYENLGETIDYSKQLNSVRLTNAFLR